jgi:excisionase family DNA binding protein
MQPIQPIDNHSQDSRWLTIQEVALSLHVSRDTVERWINRGEIRAVDVSARRKKSPCRSSWRISAESLETFLEGRANHPPMPTSKTHRIRSSGVIEFIK